jgi:hypothetical protein
LHATLIHFAHARRTSPRPAGEFSADATQLASLTITPADNAAEVVEQVEERVLAE